ncbi:hypothetical protein TNCV_4172011 [Trichonephila clavipes]|nr:hypothetical protein TNCV_4172011 [Trichonephila clavipes]
MGQWMKHESITTNLNKKDRQLSGQQSMKAVQCDQKTQTSAGKVMASVFCDAHGILLIDYLEKGEGISSENYMAFLNQLNEKIKEKFPQMQKRKSAVSPKCSASQVQEKDGQIEQIALLITFLLPVPSRS